MTELFERLASMVAALGAGAVTGLVLPLALAQAPRPAVVTPVLPARLRAGPVDHSRKAAHPPTERAGSLGPNRTERFDLTFWNIHTRQILPVPTATLPEAAALNRFLRCRVTGAEGAMHAEPFALAAQLARRGGRHRVHVISGFRSPKFNAQLRKKGHEVAESSYHMTGAALDFRIPGLPTPAVTTELEHSHDGGVGRYRHSNFVHVDTGPRRRWRGR